MSTTRTGNVGEARVALELAKRGYEVHMIGGPGVDLLAIMPGVASWTVQVKTTSGTGPKGSRKWQPGAKSRNNPAADVYVFYSLARDAFHIIQSDVLGEEMRKGHADYVGRAETEQKRQQRLNTTHAGWMDYEDRWLDRWDLLAEESPE